MPDDMTPEEFIPYEELESDEQQVLQYFITLTDRRGVPVETIFNVADVATLHFQKKELNFPPRNEKDRQEFTKLFGLLRGLVEIEYLQRDKTVNFGLNPSQLPPLPTTADPLAELPPEIAAQERAKREVQSSLERVQGGREIMRQERRTIWFTENLREHLLKQLNQNPNGYYPYVWMTAEVATKLGVSDDEAQRAIENLLEKQHLYTIRREGRLMITATEPSKRQNQSEEAVSSRRQRRIELEQAVIGDDEITLATDVVQRLVKDNYPPHHPRPINELKRNLAPDMTDGDFLSLLRRLVRRDYLAFINPRQQDYHNRRRGPAVRLPKGFKERWEQSRATMIAALALPLETPTDD